MKPDPPNNDHSQHLPVAERIAYLIAGFLSKTITAAEHDELDAWVMESDDNMRLFEELTDEENIQKALDWRRQVNEQRSLQNIREELGLGGTERRPFPRYFPYAIAALLLFTLVSLILFISRKTGKDTNDVAVKQQVPANVKDHDKAVLTLADGRTIILDDSGNGLLAKQGNIQIQKGNGAQLVYSGNDGEMRYNTVSTPRGGQYKIVLGDGTEVWLNAESSIRFPAGFDAKQRQVELRGEAYFEVAKNPSSPFKVTILTPAGDGGTVTVLGTHFNVNAYADEGQVMTTLLEGSVRVDHEGKTTLLKPGQQAQVGESVKTVPVDAQKEIAWKNGLFIFHDASIAAIGAQLARWYDLDIEMKGNNSVHYNATIDRSEPIENVLRVLEATQRVHFELQGKKLIIRP
jgi:ferric-dicitrate binding protein FerR (iron transport regulator)